MRGIGYTLASAIADLVDNSLTAEASEIDVQLELTHETPHLVIRDNGRGMSSSTLIDAMRMGTTGPDEKRTADDLGRFGLGMKTATLSQGRVVSVMSRTAEDAQPSVRRWDLDHVRRTSQWQLLGDPGPAAERWLDWLQGQKHGTVIVIEALDRCELPVGTVSRRNQLLARTMKQVRQHLSVAFHRFIEEDGVCIRFGQSPIRPWDPFMVGISTLKPQETLVLDGTKIPVQPYVLPHHSRVSEERWEDASGPQGWMKHQGFYIYRCRRLIVPGTWLRLVKGKQEQTKLARIRIDLPNTMDTQWQLNVMKVQVRVPPTLTYHLKRIGEETCGDVKRVYGLRGEKAASSRQGAGITPMWVREEENRRIRYRLNRRTPLLQALLDGSSVDREALLSLMKIIEATIPVAAIVQDPAKNLDSAVTLSDDEILGLYEAASYARNHYVKGGIDPKRAWNQVLASPGFSEYREQLESLDGPPSTETEK